MFASDYFTVYDPDVKGVTAEMVQIRKLMKFCSVRMGDFG